MNIEDFLGFSEVKSRGAKDHCDKAKLDLRVMVGSICVGDHKPLLHTKYINCGPHGFRQEGF